MKTLYRNSLVVTLLFVATFVQAQTVSPVDFMRMNPYQMKANPATDLPYESVMSLVIGNIDLDVQNTTLRYDNLFEFDAQGRPAAVNLRQFANSLKESNFIGFDANIDFFTLFRRLNKGMITINYGLKVQGDTQFNDGLFKLLGYGNGAFVGENNPVEVDLDMNAQAYQEFAVGYQWNVNEKLSLGTRAKLLFGLANVTTDAFDVKLYTDADSYALRLKENIAMRMAVPSVIYTDEGQLMTNGLFKVGELFQNLGFGIDLGAEYRFNDKFSAVAAVNDLGFIHWGVNNIEMTGNITDAGQFYDDDSFLFNGMDINQLQIIIEDESYREVFLDTLKQYFHLGFAPLEKYNTMLNTNLLLRGNYDIDAHNRFSLQTQGRFLGSGFRPAMTLAYNGYFYDKLDVCVSYTALPGSYDNIGLGIAGRLFKTCQIYLTTNDVLEFFKPLNTSAMNVQCGIVFVLRLPEKQFVGEPEMLEELE